jgi:hypothetical protein
MPVPEPFTNAGRFPPCAENDKAGRSEATGSTHRMPLYFAGDYTAFSAFFAVLWWCFVTFFAVFGAAAVSAGVVAAAAGAVAAGAGAGAVLAASAGADTARNAMAVSELMRAFILSSSPRGITCEVEQPDRTARELEGEHRACHARRRRARPNGGYLRTSPPPPSSWWGGTGQLVWSYSMRPDATGADRAARAAARLTTPCPFGIGRLAPSSCAGHSSAACHASPQVEQSSAAETSRHERPALPDAHHRHAHSTSRVIQGVVGGLGSSVLGHHARRREARPPPHYGGFHWDGGAGRGLRHRRLEARDAGRSSNSARAGHRSPHCPRALRQARKQGVGQRPSLMQVPGPTERRAAAGEDVRSCPCVAKRCRGRSNFRHARLDSGHPM